MVSGSKHTEDSLKKIAKNRKGKNLGNKSAKGYHHTNDAKLRNSKSHSGENAYQWIKDRSLLQKYGDSNLDRRSSAYREWRKLVKNRDNWECRISNQDCFGKLIVHHILGWTEFPELRYEVNNGITLCQFHHPRKRNDEKRLRPVFNKLVKTKA